MKNEKKTYYGLILALILGFFANGLTAAKDNLAQIYMITPKAGHEAELYEAINEHAEWRREAGDPWAWAVYQTTTGKDLGTYIIRSGNHSWSCFDAYADFLAKGSVEWNANVAPHISATKSVIMADHETIHDWPEDPSEASLINVTWYDINPGMMETFFEVTGAYHEAIQEHDFDTHYSFAKVVSGDSNHRVVLALPFKDYSDMEEPEENLWEFMTRVMGEEKMKELGEKWKSCIQSSEGYIVRFHPELSVLPEPEE